MHVVARLSMDDDAHRMESGPLDLGKTTPLLATTGATKLSFMNPVGKNRKLFGAANPSRNKF